jgi:hypothetical protein
MAPDALLLSGASRGGDGKGRHGTLIPSGK